MKLVDLYLKARYAVQVEGLSKRAAARRFGIDPKTVDKMMTFSVPPGYVRTKPPVRPKLDPFIAIIDKILADDKSRPKKQQHTAKRIFERLKVEHGFTGGITIVKDYVAGVQQRAREMFVPLAHAPGHAQADFGEALAVIGGVEQKIHYFAFDLPHSDACFVVAYPAETTTVAARQTLIERAAELARRWPASSASERRGILGACLSRVEVRAETIEITVRALGLVAAVHGNQNHGRPIEADKGPTTVLTISRRRLRSGLHEDSDCPSITSLFDKPVRFTRVFRLSFLAPEITKAIIQGSQPPEFSAIKLMRAGRFACLWSDQRRELGFD